MPKPDAGWTDLQLELVKVMVLDHVQAEDEAGRVPEVTRFVADISTDERLLKTAAKALESDGLVKTQGDFDGGLSVMITPAGDAVAQTRRERRLNRMLRAVACRDALLDWCYHQGEIANIGSFPGATQAYFEGDAFTEDEIAHASDDLKEMGLVSGSGSMGGGVIRPSLTAAGKKVVEDYGSSIRASETGGQAQAGQTTVHIEGGISGQFTVGNHNQISQNNGVTNSDLTDLLKAVLDAAAGTGSEDRVAKLVAQLQLEADEDNPEPTIVNTTLDRLQDTAARAGSSALVAAAGQLFQYCQQMLGLG